MRPGWLKERTRSDPAAGSTLGYLVCGHDVNKSLPCALLPWKLFHVAVPTEPSSPTPRDKINPAPLNQFSQVFCHRSEKKNSKSH